MAKTMTLEEARVVAQDWADKTGLDIAIRIRNGLPESIQRATGTETDYVLGEVITPNWERSR